MKGFLIPRHGSDTACSYEKYAIRGDTDISIVGVGVRLKLCDSLITEVRLALGGVAPTPIRATKAEKYLLGKACHDDVFREAGQIAAAHCSPITDQRATKEYRREIVKVQVARILKQTYKKMQVQSEI